MPIDALVSMRLNVLVIDLAVLGPAGWSYLEKVCERLPALGVIVCTGRSSVSQRVRGLRLGADDWITKPCHPEELIARAEAVARRRRRAEAARVEAGPVKAGELEIRADQFQAFVGGRSVDLTRREFELIQLLADVAGQVLPREEIYQRVWGYAMVHGDRSVDVFVRKLRQKLEKASPQWRYIHTHFGIGYRFAAESLEPAVPVEVEARAAEVAARRARVHAAGRHPGLSRVSCDAWAPTARSTSATSSSSSGWRSSSGWCRAAAPGSSTIYNLLTIVLTAGLLFFGYRLYMEHRATIFGLGDQQRAVLYGSLALASLALLATSRLWDAGRAGRADLDRADRAGGVGRVPRVADVLGVLSRGAL